MPEKMKIPEKKLGYNEIMARLSSLKSQTTGRQIRDENFRGLRRRQNILDLISDGTQEEYSNFDVDHMFASEKVFNEVGVERMKVLLETIEGEVKERKKLLTGIKKKYAENNREGLVQRYIDSVYMAQYEEKARDFRDDDYMINSMLENLHKGKLEDLDLVGLTNLSKLNQELDLLYTKINPGEIEAIEKEAAKRNKIRDQKRDKEKKAALADSLSSTFVYQEKLFTEMMGILKIDSIQYSHDSKKFKNCFSNLPLETLESIRDLYQKVREHTLSQMSGHYPEEEDLLLGLMDLQEAGKI